MKNQAMSIAGGLTTALIALSSAHSSAHASGDCNGDLNGDDKVDGADLSLMLSTWGPCTGSCVGDVDLDGKVQGSDLTILLSGWGTCPDDGGSEGDGPFNYGEALQKSITFYAAQRVGDLPEDNRLDWRGDCFDFELEQVNGSYDVDPRIINRYMDAGDSPTFVLPISSAMTTMAWSGIEFEDGYRSSGQMDDLLNTLKWHADWCIAAHPEPEVFCGQIGQGDGAHSFWGAPEIYTQATGYRPKIWWLTPEHPGSEPAAESAAFLAAASMLFASDDPTYAATLLLHARQLYEFANTHRGNYTESIPGVSSAYNSWSGYHDELCWAAAWLHRATGEQSYLDASEVHYANSGADPFWAQSWDGKINGAACLLAALTGKDVYNNYVRQHLEHWLPGGGIAYTPGGLAWLNQWGSLRYAANTAFIAFAYAEMVGDTPDGNYRAFGEQQINYILGDNPRNSSYVCGFGENPPVKPHHRGAHGSWNDQIQDPGPNRHVLWGALVGGPASADDYDWSDNRNDWIANEVACDYNAGFTAALARMSMIYGGDSLSDAVFPPKEDSYGNEMFVEASIIENGATSTRIRCMLNNRSAWPARMSEALSYRIHLDLSEVFDAGYTAQDVLVQSGFLDGGTLGGLQVADAGNDLYYFEISYDDETIGPGPGTIHRRECQVTVGLGSSAPATAWDAGNDPSLSALPFGLSSITKTEMISVYDDGVLIYGEEGVVDCNDNGVDDAEEIAEGTTDLDGNGRPDECDPDCNGDGVPDAYEISQGAFDCDGNGVPDGCETFADCDQDGVGDACAIGQGLVEDCDGNGIPDTCDIDSGADDSDSDGILDACQLDGIDADFLVIDDWGSGFTAELRIVNNSEEPVPAVWTLEFDTSFDLTGLWPAEYQILGNGRVVVNSPEWSSEVSPGESFTIGIQGSHAGTISPPSNMVLNGSPVDIQ